MGRASAAAKSDVNNEYIIESFIFQLRSQSNTACAYRHTREENRILKVAMAEFHRKIELQTTEDLQYLVANARRAAKEYLDKDFPPDLRDEGDNALHERIERNVDEVCTFFLSSALHVPPSSYPSNILT